MTKFLKQNWPNIGFGISILALFFIVRGVDKPPESALISAPVQLTAIVADNVITGNDIKGTKIIWDGVVETNMTYGRIRVKRTPESYPYTFFVIEEYDGKNLHREHGTKIRVWGEVTGIDVCLECEGDQYLPWVLVEKIENI